MFWPCETRTSTCRSFATISSGLYRFLAIAVLLDVKDIPQVGPLQWGRIKPIQWQPIRPWKTICECGIVGNLLPTFHCRRSLSLLPSAAQRHRRGVAFSLRLSDAALAIGGLDIQKVPHIFAFASAEV